MKIQGSLLARNAILNLIGQTVPLLVGVVTIPAVIRGLGTERFGVLALAWAVEGYTTIFDLGLGRATVKFVAEALGRGDRERLRHLVWTSMAVKGVLGLLGGLTLAALTPLLVARALNLPLELRGEVQSTFYILSLSIPVLLLSSSLSGVLEAGQRFDLVNLVRVPSGVLSLLIPLLGVLWGLQLPGIVALLVGARLVVLAAHWRFCFTVYPDLRRSAAIGWHVIPPLLTYGGWITVSNLAGPIFAYLERFLIAAFLSVGALTFYAAPFEIISRVAIIPTSITMTLFPAASSHGANNRSVLQEMFARALKYFLFILTPILAIFLVFGGSILSLWLGEDFARAGTGSLHILAIAFFLNSFAHVPLTAIYALGRPELKARLDLVNLPIYVGLCWWLIPKAGIAGAALAKLGGTVIDGVCLFWLAKGVSGIRTRELLSQKLRMALLISGAFVAAISALKLFSTGLSADVLILASLVGVYIFAFLKAAMDARDWSAFQNVRIRFFERPA